MKHDAINALHELAGEAQDNGNSSVWIARRVELIKAALESAPAVEPPLFNTCLSNAKQEPAQAVPVGYMTQDGLDDLREDGHGIIHRDCKLIEDLPVYTVPPAIDRNPLTDEEMRGCAQAMDSEPLAEGWPELIKFARAIEAAHGIKEGDK